MDETAGEVPVAFVVRAAGSTISEEEVKEYIAKQVGYGQSLGCKTAGPCFFFLTIQLKEGAEDVNTKIIRFFCFDSGCVLQETAQRILCGIHSQVTSWKNLAKGSQEQGVE